MQQPPAKRILVGGATGFLARNIITSIQKQYPTYKIVAVARNNNTNNTTTTNSSVTHISWQQVDQYAEQHTIDVAINLTGENVTKSSWNAAFKDKLYTSRLVPTKKLLQIMSKQQLKAGDSKLVTFIGTSAIGIYPSSANAPARVFTEDDYPNAHDLQSPIVQLCHAIEDVILNDRESVGISKFVMRPSIVLGHDAGALKELLLPFRMGVPVCPGNGTQGFPFIHVQDMSDMYVHVMEKQQPVLQQELRQAHAVINGVAPEKHTYESFSNLLRAELLHAKKMFVLPMALPVIKSPQFVMQLMMGKEPSTLICEGQWAEAKRAQETGFQFKHPQLQESLRDLIVKL